jgi:transketolase
VRKNFSGRFESFGVKYYGASGETEEVYKIEELDMSSMVKALLKIME